MTYRQIECGSWGHLLEQVMVVTAEFEERYSNSGVPFFRGHSSPSFQLLPGFLRTQSNLVYQPFDEMNFYYEFRARAGALHSLPGISFS